MKPWMLKRIVLPVAALLCASWCLGETAKTSGRHLRTYEFDILGPSIEAAMKQAGMHAVRSAVGEFYCSDEMILARDLLGRYLENSYRQFVASEKILSRRESQGIIYLRVAFIVDRDALEKDLRQKRFFYKPRRRPFFYVSVAEAVDGTPATGESVSRGTIHEALAELLTRYEARVIYGTAPSIDLTKNGTQLEEARVAAQRAGVEVLLTGSVDLKTAREKKIHFDDYTFFDAQANLTLIRVDDGKILAQGTYEAGAGNVDRNAANRVASSRVVSKILRDVIPPFAEQWERTMTDNAAIQVMVVGLNEAEAAVVRERLATRLRDVEVHRRSHYEDVVVFNLYYPSGKTQPDERKRVEKVLRDMVAPRLKVTPTKVKKHVRAQRVS